MQPNQHETPEELKLRKEREALEIQSGMPGIEQALTRTQAKELVSEVPTDAPSAHGAQQAYTQDDAQTSQQDDQSTPNKQDREAYRQYLLKNAPQEAEMRAQVRAALQKRQLRLESAIQNHSRKKNHHHLERAFAQLREVVAVLENLARASYEALKELWLKWVHKMA